jgi:hypothetical protein
MANRIEVRVIGRATFEGSQWEPICDDLTGEIFGYHANGTDRTVYISDHNNDWSGEVFAVPDRGEVLLQGGLAILSDPEPEAEAAISAVVPCEGRN